ncbi:unnamed protein product [Psylliodes chrysocephalus]|uniref:Pericentrin/AKAP-450 centrosomal targeting domain-containing protein n=1 Tax=Psylliodes chrysocephalus TaxID=3402493 RepID=A0A9P0CUJ3_9CUCU|nr:unnamed protein product [Psylliodes chrysocephala]
MEECEVPLQQLARLKEKLIRHSRAEDAAMKRIRDLEMQVFRLKQEIEETTGERDYMKKQIQEQLVLISDFQIRLDEQRIRADNIEKQTNTSFELKIYDLQYEITSLREKLQQKEKALGNQQVLLTETQDRLRNIENELITSKDDELIVSMQREVEKLRADNAKMKTKIKSDASMLPNLVGNIISDKNTDMARLRSRLDDTEKLLEEYTSLKLDKKDLKTLASMKSNGTSLEELFSILDLSQADQLRRMEYSTMSTPSMFIQRKKKSDDSAVEPEISAIAGPGTTASQFQTRNSTEISHKKVHFEDGDVEDLKTEIENLKKLVESKDDVIKEYDAKLTLLNDLEGKIEKLQSALEETEKTLTAAKETFEKEQQELKDREKDLGVQLAEKKLALEMKQKQLEVLECDSKRKDETHKNLTRELKSLEKEIVTLKNANFKNVDRAIQVKNKEIEDLTVQLARKANVDIERLEQQLSEKNNEMSSLLKEIEQLTIDLGSSESRNKLLEASLTDKDNEMKKMNKELENKMTQIESMTGELTALKEKLNKKRKIIRDIQDAMDNQKKSLESMQEDQKKQRETIDILNEDADRYQNDICILKTEIKELKKEELKKQMDEMETQIEELNKERAHLMDLLNEKEKIISQMAEDSHQLHVNLMTIKTKIKEPGNIIDLGNKLRDEQRKTAELVQEIHNLKAQLMQFKNNDMTSSIDEIADQLKRELDHSNRMDSNILSAVSDQSLNSISDMHDVEVCKKALSKEKNNKKQLLQHVHILQSKIAALQVDLERERAALVQTRTEDAQCIEQLRIQLDSCLDSEAGYKKIFDEKNAENERLEKEVNELKVKNAQNSKSESTEYKQLPSKEAVELKQLRKDFETLQGEKNQLANELSHLKQSNLETESGYKCTKDILALEVQRKNKLEEKVQNFLAREKELKDCLMQKNLEMERVVDEMSQEKADLIKQKLELLERIKSQNQFSVQAPPSTPSPSEFFFKVQELNSALIDNKKFMDLIAKLTNEKKQLEIELDVAKNGSNRNANVQMSTNDLIARADYLFAKTLKLESVRKALIFQKRYLMQYLTSHQKECPISALPDPVVQRRQFRLEFTLKHRFRAAAFVVISLIRMKYLVRRWHSGVRIAEKINARHFKNASRRSVALAHAQSSPAHFQVGQPVSSQLFANLPTTATVAPTRNLNPFIIEAEKIDEERGSFTSEDRWSVREGRTEGGPWSGNTPPSKEKLNRMNFRSTESNRDDITPLRAPQLLAQFVERFDQMQEKLGFVVESNSS